MKRPCPKNNRVNSNMLWKTFFSVFVTIFLAAIGDKTQVATMLFSSDFNTNKWAVCLGSSAAFVSAAGIGVLFGAQLQRVLSPHRLKLLAGIGLIGIGL